MARSRFLITYDIADDKRRNKVHDSLRDRGDRLQYSVFRCDLNPRELIALRARLHGLVHHEEDQVLIIDLGPSTGQAAQRIESVGRAYRPEPPIRIV